jgi:integrase/recombinase XerC
MLPVPVGPETLLSLFLSGRAPTTIRSYAQALDRFRRFIRADTVHQAVSVLLDGTPGEANFLVLRYRASMLDAGLAPQTINLRLVALRSLVKTARLVGLVSWSLDVSTVPAQRLRDTRGPGHKAVCALLVDLHMREDAFAVRNRAIVHLLYHLALRVAEVSSLDLSHVDLFAGRLLVLGKGRLQREWLSVPAFTCEALSSWISLRGAAAGPLFLGLGPAVPPGSLSRLGVHAIWSLVRGLGASVGVSLSPHGLRHTAVTEACKLAQQNGVGLEEVCQFSRHKNVSTLLIYRDRERDVQGTLASMISERTRLEVS